MILMIMTLSYYDSFRYLKPAVKSCLKLYSELYDASTSLGL